MKDDRNKKDKPYLRLEHVRLENIGDVADAAYLLVIVAKALARLQHERDAQAVNSIAMHLE